MVYLNENVNADAFFGNEDFLKTLENNLKIAYEINDEDLIELAKVELDDYLMELA